jgi:hypothetical protein
MLRMPLDRHEIFFASSQTLCTQQPGTMIQRAHMMTDRAARLAIAERIAEAENRVAQLRGRVERLRSEGSDASQAIETLHVVARNLSNLYVQQSLARRSIWASNFAKAG